MWGLSFNHSPTIRACIKKAMISQLEVTIHTNDALEYGHIWVKVRVIMGKRKWSISLRQVLYPVIFLRDSSYSIFFGLNNLFINYIIIII